MRPYEMHQHEINTSRFQIKKGNKEKIVTKCK